MAVQKWKTGAKLEVPLKSGIVVPAMMLNFPEIAFFDPDKTDKVLFRLWVHKSAWTQGRWKKVGNSSVPHELESQVPRFKQDPISGALTIYLDEVESNASAQDCEGLERAAVWEASHVEDRLEDFFAGKPNKWVESLALRIEVGDA